MRDCGSIIEDLEREPYGFSGTRLTKIFWHVPRFNGIIGFKYDFFVGW